MTRTTHRFPLADGMAVVVVEEIARGVYEYALTTTAPGWGGLYGVRPRRDTRFATDYSATVAALNAARRYWRDKGNEHVVAALDTLVGDYCFDPAGCELG